MQYIEMHPETSKTYLRPVTIKRYPSKLLLTGEHAVLMGSTFIAMPLEKYFGQWVLTNKNNDDLKAFFIYLKKYCSHLLDTTTLASDLRHGYKFESNIPNGYGLGSSGALCAALYTHYAISPEKKVEALKKDFAALESFYHGKSSGIDPLVSYTNTIIWGDHNKINTIDTLNLSFENNGFFIIDSGKKRDSKKHVDHFQSKIKDITFKDIIKNSLIPINKKLSCGIIDHDIESIKESMVNLSLLQKKYFREMIPDNIYNVWSKGIKSGEYYLKLCGAGGGGYFLGWSDVPVSELRIEGFDVIPIYG